MIIPIRSESDTDRLPVFTMGLIVANLLVWLFTVHVVSSQFQALAEIHSEMLSIEKGYADDLPRDRQADQNTESLPESRYRSVMKSADYERWSRLNGYYREVLQNSLFFKWGFQPGRLNPLKILTAMFLHNGFLHVFFNMLFLWIVGCNIEDEWGWRGFASFYLLSGYAAAGLHLFMNPGSLIPCVGASGAIAGVMGAFMIRHFKTKIRFFYFYLIPVKPFTGTFSVMAGICLPIWLGQQFAEAKWNGASGGVAYWEHIGGFVFGAVVGRFSVFFDTLKIPARKQTTESVRLSPERLMDLHRSLLDGKFTAVIGYLPQIRRTILEDRENVTARLVLAELYFEKGRIREAALQVDAVIFLLYRKKAVEALKSVHGEVLAKNLDSSLSEKSLLRLAMACEWKQDFPEAFRLYERCLLAFPRTGLRSKIEERMSVLRKTASRPNDALDEAGPVPGSPHPDQPPRFETAPLPLIPR
jgi:membrane associated rhomboid family serine protease